MGLGHQTHLKGQQMLAVENTSKAECISQDHMPPHKKINHRLSSHDDRQPFKEPSLSLMLAFQQLSKGEKHDDYQMGNFRLKQVLSGQQ